LRGGRPSAWTVPGGASSTPYGFGYYDYRYQAKADGFFMDAKPRDASDRVEYDFDTSPTLEVPGDWNTQRESLLYYEGSAVRLVKLRSGGSF
jgi:hypothetical protein